MTAKIETTERTPRLTHLPRCTKLTDPERYACNCGADGLAAKLDAAGALATVPAEERARIKQAGDAAAAAAWTASLGSISAMNAAAQAAIAREVAAWHAAHCRGCGAVWEDPEPGISAYLCAECSGEGKTHESLDAEDAARRAAPETLPGLAPLTPSEEAALLAFRAGQAVTRDLLATDAVIVEPIEILKQLPAERVTEEELQEIERFAAQYKAHAGERLGTEAFEGLYSRMLRDMPRLAAEVRALRPAPAADASLEAAERIWRGEWQRIAADIRSMSEAGKTPADILAILLTHLDMMKPLAVVRAVDASRPGLTEEQADAIALGCLQVRADLQRHAIKRAILRVDRGETGPTWGQLALEEYRRATEPERPAGLTRAMHDASTRPSVPPGAAFGEWPEPEAADPPEPDKARADAAEKRLADLRAWAADIVERSREEAPKHPGKANTTWTILSVLEWVVARIDGKEG